MNLQTFEKASRFFLVGCGVVMIGIIAYAEKSLSELADLKEANDRRLKDHEDFMRRTDEFFSSL
jgi:hypothetical protein